MNLILQRMWFTDKSTIGSLFIEKAFECYTLEDCVRDVKIYGETAIPKGKYEVVMSWSVRFQEILPRLLDVPKFTGILIHPGNTDKDTQGCILVGKTRGIDWIGESRAAFTALNQKLKQASKAGETIIIEVT